MSDLIEVCPESELEPGDRKIVEVGRQSVGVFNIDGEYFAVLNVCGHQYGPICEGQLLPEVEATYVEPTLRVEERLSPQRTVLRCPWHGWTYDVRTGQHTGDPEKELPTFDVVVEGETVFVEI